MRKIVSLFTTALMLLSLQPAGAEYRLTEARINYMKGKVDVQRTAAEDWKPAFVKMTLYTGNKVKCEANSETEIVMNDGSVVKMRDSGIMEIELLERDRKAKTARTALKLYQGKILGAIRKLSSRESKFTLSTPTAVAGIRGTVFGVFVEGDTTELNVLNGEVGIRGAAGGEVLVRDKMMTTVAKGDSAKNPVAMTAAKIAFITMWAGASLKIGTISTAAATAWYTTTPAIIGGATVVAAAAAIIIIVSQGEDEQPATTSTKTIPAPPGWPGQ